MSDCTPKYVEKAVTDYDFAFVGGQVRSLTLFDEDDTVETPSYGFKFTFANKFFGGAPEELMILARQVQYYAVRRAVRKFHLNSPVSASTPPPPPSADSAPVAAADPTHPRNSSPTESAAPRARQPRARRSRRTPSDPSART